MRKLTLTFALLALLTFPVVLTAQALDANAEVVASLELTPEIAQVADPTPEVAVVLDVIAVPTDVVSPAVTIPETPEQVGQQVVQAADNFKNGAWIAGILALISVALYFVNRYVKKTKTDKAPK